MADSSHLEGSPSPGYLQSCANGCLYGYSHPYCAPEGDPCYCSYSHPNCAPEGNPSLPGCIIFEEHESVLCVLM